MRQTEAERILGPSCSSHPRCCLPWDGFYVLWQQQPGQCKETASARAKPTEHGNTERAALLPPCLYWEVGVLMLGHMCHHLDCRLPPPNILQYLGGLAQTVARKWEATLCFFNHIPTFSCSPFLPFLYCFHFFLTLYFLFNILLFDSPASFPLFPSSFAMCSK